jgi:hypothetical protein
LEDVEKRLRPLGERELEVLKKMKTEDRAARGLPEDDAFYIWDMRYYDRIFRENTLQLDDEAIKTYFRVDRVVPTILRIYQDLLGVRFEEVKGETWHPGACSVAHSRSYSRRRRCAAVRRLGEGRCGRRWLHRLVLSRLVPEAYGAFACVSQRY